MQHTGKMPNGEECRNRVRWHRTTSLPKRKDKKGIIKEHHRVSRDLAGGVWLPGVNDGSCSNNRVEDTPKLNVTKAEALDLFRRMSPIRRFEERAEETAAAMCGLSAPSGAPAIRPRITETVSTLEEERMLEESV